MANTNYENIFTWQTFFLVLIGICGVGGMMYYLFTDPAYDGMGGAGIDSSYIVNIDTGKSSVSTASNSSNKKESRAEKSAKEKNKILESKSPIAATKPVEVKQPPKVEVKPMVVAQPIVQPKPVVIAKPVVVVKATPIVQPKPVVVAKPVPVKPPPAVVFAKPATVVHPKPVVVAKTETKTSSSFVAKPIKPKEVALKPTTKEDKVMSEEELKKLMGDILQKGNEAGIYAKCVQLRNTAEGNNKSTMRQVEAYLRSHKFVIAGRETVSSHVKGYQIVEGDGCLRLTLGTF